MRLAMPHNAPASLFVHGVMHRIKTYNAISSKGLDRFELERYEVGQDIANLMPCCSEAISFRKMRFPIP